MLYAYRKAGGIATDVRFVPDDFVPGEGEFTGQADSLPSAESLSDGAVMLAEKRRAAAMLALQAHDLKAIRPIREWLAAQQSAPQIVKDIEAQAEADRLKLR